MKSYNMALKYDKSNFNIVKEHVYLQLYLKQYNSFCDSAKKALDMKPNLVLNWVIYAIAQFTVFYYYN